jgi:hypothetical protein
VLGLRALADRYEELRLSAATYTFDSKHIALVTV